MSEKTNKVCVNIDQSDEQNGGFSDTEKQQARTNIGAGDGKVDFVQMGGQQPVVERSTPYVITSGSGSTYLRNEEATKKFYFVPDFDNTKYGKYAKINAQGRIVWDDAPTGLPAFTQNDAGKALILDANGEPIWSDSLIDSEFSFSYNGNLKTEKIKKISAKRAGSTEQGYDHDILAIKSNDFSGIGGNITRVEKEFEMVPHNQNTGFIYSNGLGLEKKEVSFPVSKYIDGSVSVAIPNSDGYRIHKEENGSEVSIPAKAGQIVTFSGSFIAEASVNTSFNSHKIKAVFGTSRDTPTGGCATYAQQEFFFASKEIDEAENPSSTQLRYVTQSFTFSVSVKIESDRNIPIAITIYDPNQHRDIYRYYVHGIMVTLYPLDWAN